MNSLDEHGCSLLHYVAALDYHEIVNLLHEYGADLSLKTGYNSGGENMTPLMIAAAKGYQKTVKKLMRLGASLWQTGSNIKPSVSSTVMHPSTKSNEDIKQQ